MTIYTITYQYGEESLPVASLYQADTAPTEEEAKTIVLTDAGDPDTLSIISIEEQTY